MTDRSRTSLTRHIGTMRCDEEPDPRDAMAAARNAYAASGGEIVLINRNWLANRLDRELLQALAATALGVEGPKPDGT